MIADRAIRKRDSAARQWVLACVDTSAYAGSVCDHAAWLASRPDIGVDVLHVHSTSQVAFSNEGPVQRALHRLADQGVGPLAGHVVSGDFPVVARSLSADIVVLGKRGVDSDCERGTLGRHATTLIEHLQKPVCLVPKVFLPIRRVLVLVDDYSNQEAIETFVVEDPRLAHLPIDVGIVGRARPEANWAAAFAARLSEAPPVILSALPGDRGRVIAHYVLSSAADLIVASRNLLTNADEPRERELRWNSLWETRAPIILI